MKGNPNSFGTFLDTTNTAGKQEREGAGDATIKLLLAVAEAGAKSLPDLMAQSGMSFRDFYSTVETMDRVGLIQVAGSPGQEVVSVTPSGAHIVAMARDHGPLVG